MILSFTGDGQATTPALVIFRNRMSRVPTRPASISMARGSLIFLGTISDNTGRQIVKIHKIGKHFVANVKIGNIEIEQNLRCFEHFLTKVGRFFVFSGCFYGGTDGVKM